MTTGIKFIDNDMQYKLKVVQREFNYDMANKLMETNWALGIVTTENRQIVKSIKRLTDDTIQVTYNYDGKEINDTYLINGKGALSNGIVDNSKYLLLNYANFLDFKKGDYIVYECTDSKEFIIGEYTGECDWTDLTYAIGSRISEVGYALKLTSVWRIHNTTYSKYGIPLTDTFMKDDFRYMTASKATIANKELTILYVQYINRHIFESKTMYITT